MFMGLVFMRSFALQNRILIKKYLSNLFAVKKAGNLNISLRNVMEFSFNVYKIIDLCQFKYIPSFKLQNQIQNLGVNIQLYEGIAKICKKLK